MTSLVVSERKVLLVEPQAALRNRIATAVRAIATVDESPDFESARRRLAASPCDLVITNLRLREFNGLHLAHVVNLARLPTRVILYSGESDFGLAPEIRRTCAFFESIARVPITVRGYVTVELPPMDRRDPRRFDRRREPRGGRRLWDRQVFGADVVPTLASTRPPRVPTRRRS